MSSNEQDKHTAEYEKQEKEREDCESRRKRALEKRVAEQWKSNLNQSGDEKRSIAEDAGYSGA